MSTSAKPLLIIRGQYKLTNYSNIDSEKRDLSRPYWSYEYYRCMEDAFMVYLLEEAGTWNRNRLAKAAGRSANRFRELFNRLTDRLVSVVWYFPNSQPIYPIYQSILQTALNTRDCPFGKHSRSVLLARSAPAFYTLESFRSAFPDMELYSYDLSPYKIHAILQQHKQRKQKKDAVLPAEPEVSLSEKPVIPESVSVPGKHHHPLYDPSDPPENTVSFAIRFFGCWTYSQLQADHPQFAAGRLYANRYLI